MPELTPSERLQPALLDRLTDDAPAETVEGRDRRVLSMRQLREAVMRDLTWLLNAPSRPLGDEINQYPLIASSVLNFGMPDLTGLTVSGLSVVRLEQMVLTAIQHFEPRIVHDTVQVQAVSAGSDARGPNHMQFEITGDLCPLPMPEALYLRTEVDLETGRCEVKART